jgi:hypothetical protein
MDTIFELLGMRDSLLRCEIMISYTPIWDSFFMNLEVSSYCYYFFGGGPWP